MRFLRGSLGRVLSGIRPRPRSRHLTARGWAAVAGGAVVLTLIGVVVASIAPGTRAGAAASGLRSSGRARTVPGRAVTPAIPAATAPRTGHPTATRSPQNRTVAPRAASGMRTSCRRVAHIGDSTSVDLISSADVPDPAERLPARYSDVGVRHLLMDASGGR